MPASSRFRSGPGLDVVRVARALRSGAGHVVVTARDVEKAEEMVDAALASADPYRVVRISARAGAIENLGSLRDGIVDEIASLIEEARAAGRTVVVVIADADLASAKQLESLRRRFEGRAGAIETVRMVLIGCPVLSRILEQPSARGLATRVGMRAML